MAATRKAVVNYDELSQRDQRRVAEFVEQQAGIQLPPSKHSLVESRLRKRQRKLGYGSLKEYIAFALDSSDGQAERIYMLDALTTNKTDFYRESEHFQFLCNYVMNNYHLRAGQSQHRSLRIWSAGCSSGEEPYTLAMEMLEVKRRRPAFDFEILATDISVSCLSCAKRGIYDHHKIEPVPLELRKRYLLRSKDNKLVSMAPELREKVTFRSFNLLSDAYHFTEKFDVIFCRNVMIYFNNADRAQITQHFARCLRPGGLLFIGHSESLVERGIGLKQLEPAIYTLVDEHSDVKS